MLCNAALALLVQTAAAGPVLVVVQDLPWLDRASAVVLGVVARRLAGTRVGYRSEGHRVPRRAASRRPGGGPIFLNATPASGPARRRAVARGAALETEVGLRAGQLAAGGDAEFPEHLPEVVVDGVRAEIELGGDLRVGGARRGEPCHLGFLRGQVTAVAGGGLGRAALPGGGQFGAGTLGEAVRTDVGQQLVGQPEGHARVPRPPHAPEPLAVDKVAAGQVGRAGGAAVLGQGFPVRVFGIRPVARGERAGPGAEPQHDRAGAGLGQLAELAGDGLGGAAAAGALRCLGEVGQRELEL